MWRSSVRYFSEAKIIEQAGSSAKELGEYISALEHMKSYNYLLAEQDFNKCLEVLESRKLYGEPVYNFVLQRLAFVYRVQNKASLTEKTLEEITKNYKYQESVYPNQLYRAYNDLFLQYLHTNIPKALKLSIFLKNPKLWNLIPSTYKKDFLFYIATAKLLHGVEFERALLDYDECFMMNPGPNACFLLHNMACARWWNIDFKRNSGDHTLEPAKAILSYKEAIYEFQKAIQLFENIPEVYKPNTINPGLKNKLSGLCLTNIGEIYLKTTVYDLKEAIHWLRCAMTFYSEMDKANIGRVLVLIGIFLRTDNQVKEAEAILREAYEILKPVSYYIETRF
jgi:hypothetical protein